MRPLVVTPTRVGRPALLVLLASLAVATVAVLWPTTRPAGAAYTEAVRVGLAVGESQVTVGATGPAVLTDSSGQTLGRLGVGVTLTASGGGITVQGVGTFSGPLAVRLPPEEPAGAGFVTLSGRSYRGELEVFARGGRLTVVNLVPLEDYLLGVVAQEMPADFPLEALKAQAVAARTFALYTKTGGAYRAEGFDLDPTTRCQVYAGVAGERERGNQAVRETDGEVVTYDGRPLAAYFHSSSGGHTEDPRYVWGSATPYLKAVPDFDQASTRYAWAVRFGREELGARLDDAGFGVGLVRAIEGLGARGPGGRYLDRRLSGSAGTRTLRSEKLRFALGLPSACFEFSAAEERIDDAVRPLAVDRVGVISAGGATRDLTSGELSVLIDGEVETANLSQAWVVAPVLVPASFQFEGHGYGHGVGLSQWGARALALEGKTYQDILTYYYTGAAVGTLP